MPDTSKVVKVPCDVGCWSPGFVKKLPRLLIMPVHVPPLTGRGRRHGYPLGSVLPRKGPGLQSTGASGQRRRLGHLWVCFGDPPSGRTSQLVTEACAPFTPGALHLGPV